MKGSWVLPGFAVLLSLMISGLWHSTGTPTAEEAEVLVGRLYAAARSPRSAEFVALWAPEAKEAALARWQRLRTTLPDVVPSVTTCRLALDGGRLVAEVQPHSDARAGAPCHTVVMARRAGRLIVVSETSPWEQIASQPGQGTAAFGPPLVRALIWNADRLERAGEVDTALQEYKRALTLARDLRIPALEAAALMNLGYLQTSLDQLSDADVTLGDSLRLARQSGSAVLLARALSGVGRLAWFRSEFRRAVELYEEGLRFAREADGAREIAALSINLSAVRLDQAEYRAALLNLHEALSQARRIEDESLQAPALHNLGDLYQELGSYEEAVSYHQEALALKERLGNTVSAANTLHAMAMSRIAQARLDDAFGLLRECLRRVENGIDTRMEAYARQSVAAIQVERGEYDQARISVASAIRLATERDEVALAAASHALAGEIERRTKMWARGRQHLATAERMARTLPAPLVLHQALATRAALEFDGNERTAARRYALAAVTQLERLRQDALSESTRGSFLESKLNPYHILMRLALDARRDTDALSYAERAKARVLLDTIASGRTMVRADMADGERREESELIAELREATALVATLEDSESSTALTRALDRRRRAGARLATFRSTLYARRPEVALKRGDVQWAGPQDVCDAARDPGVLMIEFSLTEQDAYAFAVRCSGRPIVHAIRLAASSRDITDAAQQLRAQLAARDLRYRELARSLYAMLLEPLATEMKDAAALVIVPDAGLWDLPFQALLDGDMFLIDRVPVSYAPSLTVLSETRRLRRHDDGNRASLLAMGNPLPSPSGRPSGTAAATFPPLPFAEKELRTLGELYGGDRSLVHMGAEARESRLKQSGQGASVLHFATHGMFDDRSPTHSFILLGGDPEPGGEDGLLEAWEIMGLTLNADVAVLAACETARGRIGGGEGMLSLSWSFFIAGVKTTVASQWKVESRATSDLMVAFHRHLLAEPGRRGSMLANAKALQAASRDARTSTDGQHPFNWAGFVVIGTGL